MPAPRGIQIRQGGILKRKGGSSLTCPAGYEAFAGYPGKEGAWCCGRTVIGQVLQESSTGRGSGPKGSLVFVLHSHIPYCRKAGMWPFGEEWLYEAMLESYIPLLDMLQDLSSCGLGTGTPGRQVSLTLGITPILLDQLDDDYLREGFLKWAEARLRRAESDRDRFRLAGDRTRERQATEYCERYGRAIRAFCTAYEQDIAGAFGELQGRGAVEIITSAATHAYLPLLKEDTSIRGQLAAGCESYVHRFGCAPRGIWLPECAYRPGLEEYLQSLGLQYFFVDRHAVEGGEPIGVASGGKGCKANQEAQAHHPGEENVHVDGARAGGPRSVARSTFRPYLVGRSKVTCFGRNERVTAQVWSSWLGYPGDGLYREFHKKDDVSGLQYWRVTSRDTDLGTKELYDGGAAAARLREHAAHFVGLVHELVADWWESTSEHAVIVAPYDAELFGHWWYEGVLWLGEVLRGLSESSEVAAKSAGKLLEEYPAKEAIEVPESSWGRGGKHDVWLNDGTAWMWDIIHAAEARVKRFAALSQASKRSESARDAGAWADAIESLKSQALREFFLLISSDWPFLVTERQATEYGTRRFREHAERFDRLMDYAEKLLESGGALSSSGLSRAAPGHPDGADAQLSQPGRPARAEPQDFDTLVRGASRDLAEIADVDDPFPWLDFSVLSVSDP